MYQYWFIRAIFFIFIINIAYFLYYPEHQEINVDKSLRIQDQIYQTQKYDLQFNTDENHPYKLFIDNNIKPICPQNPEFLPKDNKVIFAIDPIDIPPQYFLDPQVKHLFLILDQKINPQSIALFKNLQINISKPQESLFEYALMTENQSDTDQYEDERLNLLTYQPLNLSIDPQDQNTYVFWQINQYHPFIIQKKYQSMTITIIGDSDLFKSQHYEAIDQLILTQQNHLTALGKLNQIDLSSQYRFVIERLLGKFIKINQCEIHINGQISPSNQDNQNPTLNKKILNHSKDMLRLISLEKQSVIKNMVMILIAVLCLFLDLKLSKQGVKNASHRA